jgi:hypothetical protein
MRAGTQVCYQEGHLGWISVKTASVACKVAWGSGRETTRFVDVGHSLDPERGRGSEVGGGQRGPSPGVGQDDKITGVKVFLGGLVSIVLRRDVEAGEL